ncbi:Sushi, von Willebrand factor type A, EGF and pentraxin domain-containing protein 1 [Nymphon striatum]|nr:Sushi, von Willebrand factor type A, EGF and pentraxin domain-containing protein 1 [Nymphon striatum]
MRVTKIVSILLIVVTIAYCSKKRKLKWKQRLDTLTNKKFMQGKSDLVFLLDRSGSVGAANFEIEKGFVESLLTNFVVAENATRVAVITYSRSTKLHIDYIKSPKNKCFLSEELQEVTYEGSEQTNTAAALLKAQEVLRNARKNVNKVIILLSDGISTAGKNPVDVAKILKKNNVEIFTFAIGRFLKVELDSIATDANHTFNVVNFRQFRKLARRIRGGNFFGFMNKSVYPCLSGTIVPLCLAFIDYKKAFDSVEHQIVLNALNTQTISPAYIRMLDQIFGLGTSNIKLHTNTNKIRLEKGTDQPQVRRRCSPVLGAPQELQLMVDKLRIASNKVGLEINLNPHEIKWFTTLTPKSCDYLCNNPYAGQAFDPGCCDFNAKCTCGLVSGLYNCVCGPGYFGESGLKGDCKRNQRIGVRDVHEKVQLAAREVAHWLTAIALKAILEILQQRKLVEFGNARHCKNQHMEKLLGNADRATSQPAILVADSDIKFLDLKVKNEPVKQMEPGQEQLQFAKIRCPNLETPKFGEKQCTNKENPFGTVCKFKCSAGFIILGTKSRMCGPGGLWSGYEPECQSKYIEKPRIQCQPAIMVKSELGSDFAWVEWTAPSVWDNSGFAPKIESNPYYQKNKAKFKIGKHKITYKVTDASLLTSVCDVHITVLDREPPRVIFCPNDFTVNTTELEEPIFWKEPIFEDNSKSNLKIHASYRPGERFQVGKWLIYYLATDKSGNDATCEFNVIVSKNTCPYHPAPVNGALTCSDWLRGEFCQVYCNRKFDFAQKPAKWYVCDRKSVWKTIPTNSPVPWPDCSEWYIPRAMRKLVGHYFTGNCSDERVQSRMKERFLAYFKDKFDQSMYCKGEKSCKVESVKIKCGKHNTSIARLRGKRDTRPVEDLMEIELEFVVEAYSKDVQKKSVIKELVSAANGLLSVNELKDNALKNEIESNVIGSRQIELKTENTLLVCGIVNCPVGTFFNKNTKNCQICPTGQYQNNEAQLLCLRCPRGTWTVGNHNKNFTECKGICQEGTFSKTGLESCSACPRGTFQNMPGKSDCTTCPKHTTTWTVQAKNSSFCREKCLPGSFSDTGLQHCLPCSIGYYQDRYGQQHCVECPKNLSTKKKGSVSRTACVAINHCETNACKNGGTCHNLKHSFSCSCSEGFHGYRCDNETDECISSPCEQNSTCIDKVADFECVCSKGFSGKTCEVEINECLLFPCQNGGTCIDKVAGYQCFCLNGYSGDRCEVDLDLCENNPCGQQGKCTDLGESIKCDCKPGFEGEICQTNINDCADVTCLNDGSSGSSQSLPHVFYSCALNRLMQQNSIGDGLDPSLKVFILFACMSETRVALNFVVFFFYFLKATVQVYPNRAVIRNLRAFVEGYTPPRMSSPPNTGLRSISRSQYIKPISGGCINQCRADSKCCKDGINSHSCVCPLGFAGNKCEINIDDCIKNNCKNDATCTDLLNNYKCNCKPGFSGIKCEKELSANFMMTFKEPRLSNYAIWTDMPTLSEFTIDAWIQSEFHQKQSGTILSYATIHSNTTVLDNALTITDLSNVKIFVNNNPIYTDLEMDDGKWHRLTVTWSSVKEGSWRVIFDGTKVVEGKHLSENEPIPGGGILVLGQDQDAVGGNFNIMESFIGNLSRCVEFIYDVFFDLSGSLLPSNLRVKISSEFRFTLHIRMDKDGYSVAPKGAEIWANLHFRMLILIPHRLKVDSSLQSAAESDEDSDNEMDTHTPMDTITPKMAQPYYDLFHDDTENEDFDGFESDEDRV